MKRCSKCGKKKAAGNFARNRATKDGLQTWCKACHLPLQRKWNEENKERRRELGRRWFNENRDVALAQRRERYAETRTASNARRRQWERQNKDKVAAFNRRKNITRYGLTEAKYAAMLDAQGGVCALCKSAPKAKRLHIDHCHAGRGVRGLLCGNCNLGIGNFKDSPTLLRAAATYLESFDRSAEE